MSTPELIKISAATIKKHYLKALSEHLSEVDIDRLNDILGKFKNDEASIANCLKIFPKRSTAAQSDFRSFRDRFKKAGISAGVQVSLEVDTRKNLPASKRRCWFLAPNDAAEKIAEFSKNSANLFDSLIESQMALPVRGKELESHGDLRKRANYFISSVEKDAALAQELCEELQDCFKISKKYSYDPWDRSKILVGEDRTEETIRAISNATFCLILASTAYLGTDLAEVDLSRLKKCRPYIPVVLRDFNEERIDLHGLESKQMFRLDTGRSKKSYESCREKSDHKRAFVNKLFKQIELRLDKFFESHCFDDRCARLLLRENKYFTETNVAPIPLDSQDFDAQTIEHIAAQSQNALDMLEKWATTKDGPIFAAVLGEYGIGKTTTLKQLTHKLLSRRKEDKSVPLPIFIDLRLNMGNLHQDKPLELEGLLREAFKAQWKSPEPITFEPADVLRLVREEGALLIFDGLDEKLVHLDAIQARNFVRELWSALPPQVSRSRPAKIKSVEQVHPPAPTTNLHPGKLIFSCRSHYFKTIRDQGAFLRGENREGISASDYLACILLPFNEEQIRDYLTQCLGLPEKAQAAIDLFASIHNLKDLSRRPYLLSLISKQIGKLEEQQASGNIILGVTLYENLVEEWLVRDEGKHYLAPEDKRRLMEDLAAAMWRDGAKQWDWSQVRDWLGKRMTNDPVLAMHYLGDKNKFDVVETDFRTATLVLREEVSVESFRFAHTSLHEFFLACYLVRALFEQRLDDWKLPMPSIETLEFVGQLLASERKPKRKQACLTTLESLLANYNQQATELAFRYHLLAVEHNFPAPIPERVDLHSADLSEWKIFGKNDDNLLNLRNADFTGAWLVNSQWKFVELSNTSFKQAQLLQAEFENVSATKLEVDGADFTSTSWRECVVEQISGAANWYGAEWVKSKLNPVELGDDFPRHGAISKCRSVQQPDSLSNEKTKDSFFIPSVDRAIALPYFSWGHSDTVNACAWSPDGNRILSGSNDHTLKVWDANSGKPLLSLNGHSSTVMACAWSPDGNRILSGSCDFTLKVWDANSGKPLLALQSHSGPVLACAWSPDGNRILSGSGDHTLKVWDANSGEPLLSLQGHSHPVRTCAWSPDGNRILSGSHDHTLKIWDANSGKPLLSLLGHSSTVLACAWSPYGNRVLSGADDHTLKVWDVNSGRHLLSLQDHSRPVWTCAWSPDGDRILSGSDDHTLKVWDANSGRLLLSLQGHSRPVRSCAWSPSSNRILSGTYATIKVWDANSGKHLLSLCGHSRPVSTCAWSPDGNRILSGSFDYTLKIWDANSGKSLLSLLGHSSIVRACAWSPDGNRILSGSSDNTLKVWDANSGKHLLSLLGHSSTVFACAWSPDGQRILSGSSDHTLKVWNANSGRHLLTLQGHFSPVWSCAWSPDGQRILSGADDQLKVWDAHSGRPLLSLPDHSGSVDTCAWSPDGQRILSGSFGYLKVWDANSGKRLLSLLGHSSTVFACAWSPDGNRILSGSNDHTLKVWNANSGKHLLTLQDHFSPVWSCAWSPDGQRILSGADDNTLKVWDANSGEELMTLANGPNGQTATIDFRQGRILYASDEAWRFLGWRFWDPETNSPRLLPLEHFA